MDPQSTAFTPAPREDIWRFQADMLRVQHTQAEHSERLARLERRQEDDARMKSVWGSSSPFPGVLSGTPQQAPLQQPPADAFTGFDDHSLIGSLQLDADEEPRRMGATSRANSVRFDESANQSHWSHPHRSSIDLIPRSGSSLGTHPMIERTYSHKSDGRQSSTGHSVHSATSGRANSLGIDTPFSGLGTSPSDVPGFSPGLLVLGSVPSIIRCWLNDNFKHDSLLYAAVCTGSHGSFLNERMVNQLGYMDQVREDSEPKIKLPMYFPEATTRSASSRSNSPMPQLPCIEIDFTVISQPAGDYDKSIQIFIGSDVLKAHNADVLFSTNSITLYDDDHCKLTIPMVRPENDQSFRSLRTTSVPISSAQPLRKPAPPRLPSPLNGLKQAITNDSLPQSSVGSPAVQASPSISTEEKSGRHSFDNDAINSSGRPSLETRPLPPPASQSHMDPPVSSTTTGPRSSSSSSNIWGSWRREAEKPPPADTWSKVGSSYQRREQGIKVLRPTKPASRTFSAQAGGASTSPVLGQGQGQSRFFGESPRRASLEAGTIPAVNNAEAKDAKTANPMTAASTGGKTRSTNPVGGASAFSWLASTK